jgi:hypothetical protein
MVSGVGAWVSLVQNGRKNKETEEGENLLWLCFVGQKTHQRIMHHWRAPGTPYTKSRTCMSEKVSSDTKN